MNGDMVMGKSLPHHYGQTGTRCHSIEVLKIMYDETASYQRSPKSVQYARLEFDTGTVVT